MSDQRPPPSFFSQGFSAIVIVVAFLLFGGLLYLNNLPGEPVTRPVGAVPPADRAARLRDLHASEAEAAGSYQWIDQSAGIVRLPIDRAMALTQQKLSEQPR